MTLFLSIEIVGVPPLVPSVTLRQALVLPSRFILRQVWVMEAISLIPPPPPFPSSLLVVLEVRLGPAPTRSPIPLIFVRYLGIGARVVSAFVNSTVFK